MIDYDQIVKSFRSCGITDGSVLMLHSDALGLSQLSESLSREEKFHIFFDAMQEVVGVNGTLILPTFSYSVTKGEVYDANKTSSDVGLLSNYFMKLPGVHRTQDPMFSVAVRGRFTKNFLEADFSDCFGENSIFGVLHRMNSFICGMGCGLDAFTYLHYVEQLNKVVYRTFKNFSGSVNIDGVTNDIKLKYFVRAADEGTNLDTKNLLMYMKKNRHINISTLGRVPIYVSTAENLVAASKNLLKNDPYALVQLRVK
ncbi:AAC(3) family N-acetyltransferase [Polynucleobacter sp. AP-Ainpum-60-G11]|uniref:AAC(3) family N-acetyltransferase n=1 Tax=Polynucleobacter sp. AP-Ainpum-60-G11 TaxID=2576926 RepID=UPI001BFD574E|nr:AAC(3) family N-acetyltransferase [Polynucleobacter sp. AP-Ainpum-60-G11]QWE27007.1 AAC(3) family N-acetyltransferase [Polynucleobacter sp. AP-Ainpum-60-G11]